MGAGFDTRFGFFAKTRPCFATRQNIFSLGNLHADDNVGTGHGPEPQEQRRVECLAVR